MSVNVAGAVSNSALDCLFFNKLAVFQLHFVLAQPD